MNKIKLVDHLLNIFKLNLPDPLIKVDLKKCSEPSIKSKLAIFFPDGQFNHSSKLDDFQSLIKQLILLKETGTKLLGNDMDPRSSSRII